MRKITSLTLVIAGIIELITSIILYILPSGRVAYWSDYHLWGLSKTQWGDIHITVGTLLIAALFLHTYYNWQSILAYIKNKARKITVFTKSFNIALAISLYVAGGTIVNLPPMNYILQAGEYFTDTANKKYGEPPYGHAELSSLEMFCSKMQLDVTTAATTLKEAGIKLANTQETLKEIAKNNQVTPQKIYTIIKTNNKNKAPVKTVFPSSPPPGFGNKTIQEVGQEYSLPTSEVIDQLNAAGLEALTTDTIKEVGKKNNSNPMAIFEIIKIVAQSEK